MKNRRFPQALLLLLSFALTVCAPRLVIETEYGDPTQPHRVLIATQTSPFKDAVVSQVAHALKSDGGYIKVIDLEKISDESIDGFDAIAVINTCKVWRLNSQARDFLEKAEEKEKIVLLTTAANANWKPKNVRVDAITSASKMGSVERISALIARKLRGVMARGKGSEG